MHFFQTLPYIVGLLAIFWCIGFYGLFVTYKKVPRYTLAKARETVKENARNRIKNLAFIIAPVLFWFLFGKDDPPLFFIVMGLIESLGLLIVLGDFTAARLAKKESKNLKRLHMMRYKSVTMSWQVWTLLSMQSISFHGRGCCTIPASPGACSTQLSE